MISRVVVRLRAGGQETFEYWDNIECEQADGVLGVATQNEDGPLITKAYADGAWESVEITETDDE